MGVPLMGRQDVAHRTERQHTELQLMEGHQHMVQLPLLVPHMVAAHTPRMHILPVAEPPLVEDPQAYLGALHSGLRHPITTPTTITLITTTNSHKTHICIHLLVL